MVRRLIILLGLVTTGCMTAPVNKPDASLAPHDTTYGSVYPVPPANPTSINGHDAGSYNTGLTLTVPALPHCDAGESYVPADGGGMKCGIASGGGGGGTDSAVTSVSGTYPITEHRTGGAVTVALSLDGGVDGSTISIGPGGAKWRIQNLSYLTGRDIYLCDGGQCVASAAGGVFQFYDAGYIICPSTNPYCFLWSNGQMTDHPTVVSGIVASGAYGDATTNVVGGDILVATGEGSHRDGGMPGKVIFGTSVFAADTQPTHWQSTNATSVTKTIYEIQSNTGGTIIPVITGKVSGSSTHITETWQCGVVNNGGSCSGDIADGGGCAMVGSPMSKGTVGSISVALSGCNLQATTVGAAVDGSSLTWNWGATTQFVYAGP